MSQPIDPVAPVVGWDVREMYEPASVILKIQYFTVPNPTEADVLSSPAFGLTADLARTLSAHLIDVADRLDAFFAKNEGPKH